MHTFSEAPIVLCFSGLDPTGGAGIQADIETVSSLGTHATSVVTGLTVQDTQNVQQVIPVGSDIIVEQARCLLQDMPVKAFKIGLIPNIETVYALSTIIQDYPDIPVILDPIINAGGGSTLHDENTTQAIIEMLVPLTTIITPNSVEARILAPSSDTLHACAMSLLGEDCEYVLLTGGHEQSHDVTNTLYGNHRKLQSFHWPRLDSSFHGSGCTLSSSIAAFLAQGNEINSAVHMAQQYTWNSLKHARPLGMGQLIPNRFFWTDPEHDSTNK